MPKLCKTWQQIQRKGKERCDGGKQVQETIMASSNEELHLGNTFSNAQGETGNENTALAPDGPSDSRCPICLERIQNVAFLNPCFHRYCFACILEWSERKAECPLCKQDFHSFFHTIRSDRDFEEYVVPVENVSYGMYTERPDNGILYEGYSSPQAQSRTRTMEDLVRQLGISRSFHPGGISLGQIREHITIKFRRALYQSGVRVRNVQSGGFYRDISANFFHRNPARLNRLVPWLKRELRVLCGTNPSMINDVQQAILNNITIYDLDSQAFADIMQSHLHRFTNHFLHEFINFARSPFNIKAYDWRACYDVPFPTCEDMFHVLFATSSSDEGDEEEGEDGETEDSDENEEEEGESVTTNEEGTWDGEIQRPSSSSSDHTVGEYSLPTGSSDGEPARSTDNLHDFFQADEHLDTHNRHSPLRKYIFQQLEENTSVMCKSSPIHTENAQQNAEDDEDGDEELADELETLRSYNFGRGAHSSASSVLFGLGQLASSNQLHSGLQLPFKEDEAEHMDQTPLQDPDEIATKVVHPKGEDFFFFDMLQPHTGDILVIEHIELQNTEAHNSGELSRPAEGRANSIEVNFSADVAPSNSATKPDGGFSSYIRRPGYTDRRGTF